MNPNIIITYMRIRVFYAPGQEKIEGKKAGRKKVGYLFCPDQDGVDPTEVNRAKRARF